MKIDLHEERRRNTTDSSESKKMHFDLCKAMNMIIDTILEEKVPCLSRGLLTQIIRSKTGFSKRRADSEFWGIFKKLTVAPSKGIPLDMKLGRMKIGNMEYFYPLEMIRIYVLTKRLASFPGVLFYFLEDDPLADDSFHHYYSEKWKYSVKKDDSTYHGKLKGVKVAETSKQEFIPVKLAGHTPLPKGLPKLELDGFEINNESVDELPTVDVVDETSRKKIFHIQLEEPLRLGDRFAAKVHCSWPGQLTSTLSYVFTPCAHLHKGVDQEVTEVVSDKPLANILAYKFDMCSGNFQQLPKHTKELAKQPSTHISLKISNQKPSEVYLISFEEAC